MNEKVKLTELIKYQNNAKEHPQEQIDQIKASIQEFGYITPIIVDEKNVILAGHGRYEALLQLGHEEVEVKRVNHLTGVQKKQYILADNKLNANTGFDDEMLKLELEAIEEMEGDLELTGFEDEEIENLKNESFIFGDDSDFIDVNPPKEKETKVCPHCGGEL